MFGENQNKLLWEIEELAPDIIIITGDLIDRRRYDLDAAMLFIDGAMEIAPIYYVSGNHEAWSNNYENIVQRLSNAGVEILDDKKMQLEIGESTIEILGLSDPAFLTSKYAEGTDTSRLVEQLNRLSDNLVFQILLSHRPEFFDLYADANMDIIFSGHAHGGQFRIPFIGGLVAPNQGIFPKYVDGVHTRNGSTMFISRGLGNSIVPIRICNRPEIIAVTFQIQ